NAMVEPLPLVPATWITGGSLRCGWPSAARMRHIRSSERSISLGCSAASRATIESIWVMGLDRLLPRARRSPARRHRQNLRRRPGPGLAQEPAQIGERGSQVAARYHHVDHAVIPEILGTLETVGQLLADGLLDHARSGKADERTGFGDLNVTEHGVGG